MTTVVAFLSNQPTHQPCKTTRAGISTTVSCGFPIKALKPGGVLVTFVEGGMPGWTISNETGRHVVVDHLRGTRTVVRRPIHVLDATVEYGIFISRDVPDNYYEFDVFFRNPGASKDEQLLQQMLKTMRVG